MTMPKLITDDMKITVKPRAKNPFAAPVQKKNAAAVLACGGKTVAEAKRKGADAWTVRELVKRKVISVVKQPA
ncbi:MAG TPA: hypothetical protein VMM15_01265 [Bradyrhizobium sp.]|nr:hypothetical protein [Bradyrhizobium sp.]